jgi:tetrahydromethanopterin S-methyltransferase subunit G
LKAITRLKDDYTNIKRMKRLNQIFEQVEKLDISSSKSWRSQNEYFAIATNPTVYNENINDEVWRTTLERVGKNLGIGAGIKEIFESA